MAGQEPSSDPTAVVTGLNAVWAGLLVAAAPAVGYLLTWVHLVGYADQFDIPRDLIAPQLGDVLTTTFGVGLGILMLFSVAMTLETRALRWLRGDAGPIERRIGLIVVVAAVSLVLAGLSWPQGIEVLAIGAVLVIVTIGAFWPAIRHRDGTVRARLIRADAARRAPPPSPILTELQNRIGAFVLALAAAVFLVGILAYDVGSYEAHTTRDFLVRDAPGPEVVLATYGDTVILATLDRSKRAVTSELEIVKIGTTPLRLHWMTVGPLTVTH